MGPWKAPFVMNCFSLVLRARVTIGLAIALLFASAPSAFAQTSTVSWDRNSDAFTVGYLLSYGTQPGTYGTTVDVGNVVSYPVALTPGNTYYMVVRGYNSLRESGPASNEASVSIPALPTPPTATITGTLGSSGTASVTWRTTNATTVTVNGVPVALNATASYAITQTTTYTVVATGPGGSATAATTVIVPRVNCQLSAWSFTSATAWSACTSGQRTRNETWNRTIVTQPSGGGTACGALQEVRAVSEPCSVAAPTATVTAVAGSTAGTASVTWQTTNASTVTLNGAPVALSGTATYPITQTTTYSVVATGAGGTTTASATVVVPRVDCQMSGWTFTSATPWGACSSGQRTRNETWNRTITTQASGGGAACGVTQEVRVASEPCAVAPTAQLTATAGATAGTANVTWQSTNATAATLNGVAVATSGTAQFAISATTTYTLVVTGPGGAASAAGTVTLAPVDCVLSAWSLQTTSPWGVCSGGQQTRTETWARSIITSPTGGGAACGVLEEQRTAAQTCTNQTPAAPGSPTSLAASTSGSTITLGWQVPASGGAPTGYRIWVATSNGWQIVNGMAVGNVLSVSGNLPSGTYSTRIAAFNTIGESAPSPPVSFTVGAKKRPNRPLAFTASLQNSVAVLSWSAPAGDGPDTPTGYVIEAGSASGLSDVAVMAIGNQSSYQAAVPPGTYYVRVRAINELGVGDPSAEVVLQYGAGPGAPAALTETGGGPIVRLSWQAPTTGELPGSYVIEAGSAPGLADLAVLRAGSATSFTTTAPSGTYYVRVRAVASNGVAGEASNEVVVRR